MEFIVLNLVRKTLKTKRNWELPCFLICSLAKASPLNSYILKLERKETSAEWQHNSKMSCDLNLAKLELFLLCLFYHCLLRIGNALSSPYSLIWKYQRQETRKHPSAPQNRSNVWSYSMHDKRTFSAVTELIESGLHSYCLSEAALHCFMLPVYGNFLIDPGIRATPRPTLLPIGRERTIRNAAHSLS